MTNCVNAISNSLQNTAFSETNCVSKISKNTDNSIFVEPQKYTVDEVNEMIVERMNKKYSLEKSENTSPANVFKRIFKGAWNGIKNTFSFAFESMPMTLTTGVLVLAVAASSKAMFTLALAGLIGAVAGGALSGITHEFSKRSN